MSGWLGRRSLLAGLGGIIGIPSAMAQESACDPRIWNRLPQTPSLPPPRATGSVRAAGAALWFGEFGAARPGEIPIVLLHGGLASSDYWGAVIPTLTARRSVLALDTRGHGRSTLGDAALSYARMAADVLALLDQRGIERAEVVGWSDGAIAGLQLAVTQPRRVQRLFAFAANTDRAGVIAGGSETSVFREFKQRAATEYRALSPAPDRYGALLEQLGRMWQREPAFGADELKRIVAATTIAAAAHDELIALRHSQALAGSVAGARLVILPCVDHFAILQDPVGFGRQVLDASGG